MVKVTYLWYATLHHQKMHPHTKFEIPTSNNIRDMLRTLLFLTLGLEIPLFQDASKHQIWNSYLKEYKRYASDTIILKSRSEVKVTVT